jgi:hypothetical protein
VRTQVLILAPLALLAACSSGSSTPQSLDTTASPSSSASAAAPARTAAAAKPTTTSASAPGTFATRGATSTTVAPHTTQAPGKPAQSKATKAGEYTYTSHGKVAFGATSQDASGSQTLTISPLQGDVQRSTLHSDDGGDTVEEIVVRDAGSYAASLKLTSPAFTKEFRPATPLLLVPDPAAPGRSWSWSTTSTDRATHATSTNKVLRTEAVTIGGQRVDTVVLQTHLVLSGDVNYDAQVTLWWAPAYRLPVKTHTVGKGSYSGVPVSSDVTAVLQSVQPH